MEQQLVNSCDISSGEGESEEACKTETSIEDSRDPEYDPINDDGKRALLHHHCPVVVVVVVVSVTLVLFSRSPGRRCGRKQTMGHSPPQEERIRTTPSAVGSAGEGEGNATTLFHGSRE